MHVQKLPIRLDPGQSQTVLSAAGPIPRTDPRAEMALRLPGWAQPFLTWLTAKPAPGEPPAPKKPTSYIRDALLLTLGGCALSALAMAALAAGQPLFWLLLGAGLLATSSGLGLFQVVIFHHCSHGTVFATRERNRAVGRVVSAILLFKHFDQYQREHMLHHNAKKLFTDEDEFTDFVVGICELRTSLDRIALWRRLLLLLASPRFHGRFLVKRIQGALWSNDRSHNLLGLACWSVLLVGAAVTHTLVILLIAWVFPVTVLLQIATVFRILCEHRLPSVEIITQRGKQLVCEATAGVFPGAAPPEARAATMKGFFAWCLWWADMLIVQVFVRLFVLVGDAPCHDFHHRRPGKRWTYYTHARQADLEAGCPGFPLNYIETWGLFRAIDENFSAMSVAPAELFEPRREGSDHAVLPLSSLAPA